MVHDSHAYRKIDITIERRSLIFDDIEIFLSSQTVLSLDKELCALAILERISDLEPLSVTIAPR